MSEYTPREIAALALSVEDRRCYFDGCVATWKHWHGFLPGGYNAPDDPEGERVPILFTDPAPELPPGWCRDYNGAALPPRPTR